VPFILHGVYSRLFDLFTLPGNWATLLVFYILLNLLTEEGGTKKKEITRSKPTLPTNNYEKNQVLNVFIKTFKHNQICLRETTTGMCYTSKVQTLLVSLTILCMQKSAYINITISRQGRKDDIIGSSSFFLAFYPFSTCLVVQSHGSAQGIYFAENDLTWIKEYLKSLYDVCYF
jgi:hypothetical protein